MKPLNRKLLLLSSMLVACLLSAPLFASNVSFACAPDAERPRGILATVPTDGPEAKVDYQRGEIVLRDDGLGRVDYAIQITGDPVTTYRCTANGCARSTRYPCKRVDPASVPENLRWPGRRR